MRTLFKDVSSELYLRRGLIEVVIKFCYMRPRYFTVGWIINQDTLISVHWIRIATKHEVKLNKFGISQVKIPTDKNPGASLQRENKMAILYRMTWLFDDTWCLFYTHTHTHTHIYIYIRTPVCMCVCVWWTTFDKWRIYLLTRVLWV